MTPDILFDNFIIANDKYVADKFAADRYDEKNIIILLLWTTTILMLYKKTCYCWLKLLTLPFSWVKKNIKETYGGDEEVSNNFLL